MSLHLKLPGELPLAHAHAIAEDVEDAIHRAAPEVRAVQTHLEPLAERAPGPDRAPRRRRRSSRPSSRSPAAGRARLRTLDTDDGLVVLVTLALEGGVSLADAHAEATAVSERIRAALPGVADVVVHTEP